MTDSTQPKPRQYDLSAFRPKLATKKKREKYPWSTMPVLDCFLVKAEDARMSSVRSMASAKGIDLGKKFSVTAGPEGGCWVTRES